MEQRNPTGTPGPQISSAWSQWIVRCLESLDVPIHEICRELGIDVESLLEPDTRVDRDDLTLIWREAAKRSGDPSLGLRAAEKFQLGLNSLLAHLMVSSANLREALGALDRYQSLVSAGTAVRVEDRGDSIVVLVGLVEGRLPYSKSQLEFVMGVIARVVRTVAGESFEFTRVRFRHDARVDAAVYRGVFGCPVEFGASENSLLLPSEGSKTPSLHFSPGVARRLVGMAEDDLARRQAPGLSSLVEQALRDRVRAGTPTRIDDIARELHLSTRTLQRRLTEESLSYAWLLDEVRRILAAEMLEEGVPRERVASRLGFSSPATFLRAQRRWQVA